MESNHNDNPNDNSDAVNKIIQDANQVIENAKAIPNAEEKKHEKLESLKVAADPLDIQDDERKKGREVKGIRNTCGQPATTFFLTCGSH